MPVTAEPPKKLKRRWMPWWRLESPALAMCPACSIPCVVYCTESLPNGRVVQHRKCPSCGKTVKTAVGWLAETP